MVFKLTEEEKRLVQEGKLDVTKIEEHRKIHPVRSVDLNEVDQIKQEIKETNLLYRESIQKNKDLYEELQQNRKKKEELRNKIAELRIKKKKLLGLVE
ncbi:MAG: hypothetical protein U9O94_03835 [Nanoarchaeota archaeon]|nr:hypothetical protein [Nanoarchaeota archaeon]